MLLSRNDSSGPCRLLDTHVVATHAQLAAPIHGCTNPVPTCVVDQHIHSAPLVCHCLEESLQLLPLGHIAADSDGLTPQLRNLSSNLLCLVGA